MIISVILNVITLAIVAAFVMVIYMAYRKRPDVTSSLGAVIEDLFHYKNDVYHLLPFKKNLTGPVGTFSAYTPDTEDYAPIGTNSYDYEPNENLSGTLINLNESEFIKRQALSQEWEKEYGESEMTLSSGTVASLDQSELVRRQALLHELEKEYGENVGFDVISQNDPNFKEKVNKLIEELS